jgi:hypothetical protein
MTYRLKVNQQWKIALALIFIPIFFTLLYVAFILQFRNLPGGAILAAVIFIILASLAVTLFAVFNWLTVECEISMDEKKFHFKLLRKTPFMHLHVFSSNWENIENAALNEDRQHDSIFYSIQFRNPGLTLYLSDIPKQPIGDGSGSEFWKALSRHIEQYNSGVNAPEMQIHNIGYYEKPWAKVFTYFTFVFYILILLASVFSGDGRAWLRAVAFSAFAIPWLLNYYRAKKNRRNNPVS